MSGPQRGSCKICRWVHEGELNAKYIEDSKAFNAAKALQWADGKYEFRFVRQTFYTHTREHLKSAEDRFVEKAEREIARASRGTVKNASNDDFLQAVIDLGMSKALDAPETVGIDHALKAVSIREARKDRVNSLTLVLAGFITGNKPVYTPIDSDIIIEGQIKELPEVATNA